jgi:hypothetical protein
MPPRLRPPGSESPLVAAAALIFREPINHLLACCAMPDEGRSTLTTPALVYL